MVVLLTLSFVVEKYKKKLNKWNKKEKITMKFIIVQNKNMRLRRRPILINSANGDPWRTE